MKFNRKHVQSNFAISIRNSYMASILGRGIVLGIFVLWVFGLAKNVLPYLLLYLIFDVFQYVTGSVSYSILGHLQELKVLPCIRPRIVNLGSDMGFCGKNITLLVLLVLLFISSL
jgi:hypothetical protein